MFNVVVKEIIIFWPVCIDVICTKIMLDSFHRRGLWHTPQQHVTVLITWLELSLRLCETYSNSAFGTSSLSRSCTSQESNSCQGFKDGMGYEANKLLTSAALFKLLLHSYMEVLRRFAITIRLRKLYNLCITLYLINFTNNRVPKYLNYAYVCRTYFREVLVTCM